MDRPTGPASCREEAHFSPWLIPRPYVPDWLTIDSRNGELVGDFGYAT
jgi:hypothetical protein